MIITEDYFLDAKKELEKYSNLLSILKLEVFCFCFVFMLVGLKKISYQFQNIFEIYSCEKKKNITLWVQIKINHILYMFIVYKSLL